MKTIERLERYSQRILSRAYGIEEEDVAVATAWSHMFSGEDEGVKQHTYTASGVIALRDFNVVVVKDFEGDDVRYSVPDLEAVATQWCQDFTEFLKGTHIRVVKE